MKSNKLNEPKEPANSVCFEHNWNRTANMGECPKCYRSKRPPTNKAQDLEEVLAQFQLEHGNSLVEGIWKDDELVGQRVRPELLSAINQLIANQVAEARIDELRRFIDTNAYAKYGDGETAHFRGGAFIPVEDILKRLATLKGKET